MICTYCGFEFSGQLPLCPRCASPANAGQIPASPPVDVFIIPKAEDLVRPMPGTVITPSVGVSIPDETVQPSHFEAAKGGFINVANAAKKQAESAGESLSGIAGAAKKRVEEAGGLSGITDNAKKIAQKSAVGAKNFAGKAAVGAKGFADKAAGAVKENRESPRVLILAGIVIFAIILILLCLQSGYAGFNVFNAILVFFGTVAFTIIVSMLISQKQAGLSGVTSTNIDDKIQIISAGGYVYMLNAAGVVYRVQDGGDKVKKLDITGAGHAFADKKALYICMLDGSIAALPHGLDMPAEIVPAGTVLGNKATIAPDGYIYFSSIKVAGNPICRIKANGNAIQIITE